MTCRMSGPSHGSGVRPALCQAMAQLLHCGSPTSAATASAVDRSSSGIGIAGVDDALRQRVSREQHLGVLRHRGELQAQVVGDELYVCGLGGPALDAGDRDAVRIGSGLRPVEILADGEGRVVRCQHQSHDVPEALGGDGVDRRLDLRLGVLQAEAHDVLAGRGGVERRLQRGALGLCAGGQRAGSAECVVAGGELGERFGRGWASAPDVGVVGLDLVTCAGSAVRHEEHGRARVVRRVVRRSFAVPFTGPSVRGRGRPRRPARRDRWADGHRGRG